MADVVDFGVSKRGKRTLIYHNYEFWFDSLNSKGQTIWRCSKRQACKCYARVKTEGNVVIGKPGPDHTHTGNIANALSRKAVGKMKEHMAENIATPSASQGSVVANLDDHVLMALPKRASLSRVLRRHRQIKSMAANGAALPPIPTDVNFDLPPRFQNFLLHDSRPGGDRLLIFGDRELLRGLSRSELWLADGTFKVVPTLLYQLYSIHFSFAGGINPAGVYCLLANKSRETYDNLMGVLKQLIPTAAPHRILVDFESAAINSFRQAYPNSDVTGCYFHLCQSVLRKVNECGLKRDYETDNEIRGFVRCLPALSHVPVSDVLHAFELLCEVMPANEKVNEVVTYFEHTYIRGRRRPGRGEHYGTAVFPIPLWNQFLSAGDGIARTTNSVEGWHHSLQALFMCQHPTMWTFLAGIERDCQMTKAAYLQATAGAVQLGRKKYRDLKERVARCVGAYAESDTLTYLRSIAHLSHV